MGKPGRSSPAAPLPIGAGSVLLALCLIASSGAIALVLELCWVRRFAPLLGSSAPALAWTVSSALAGLALGSASFARRAGSLRRPWRAYAALELGVAATALAVVPLHALWERMLPSLDAAAGAAAFLAAAARAALVPLAILPATFLLGGTLPVLVRALDDGRSGGRRALALYAASTTGAVLGALAFPFLLLPALGAPRSYLLACAGSAAIASCAWLHGRGLEREAAPVAAARPGPAPRTLLIFAAASGSIALGSQIVWARVLAQVHHSALHASALVLALFLAALACGAALAHLLLARGAEPWRLLRSAWSLAAPLSLLAAHLFVRRTDGLAYLAAESPAAYLRELLALGLVTFFAPTLCLGLGLPACLALATREERSAAARVGNLLAANGVGSVLGPLLASFVLLPVLGMWGALATLALALAALSLAAARAGGVSPLAPSLSLPALACLPLAWLAIGAPRVHLERASGEELAWIDEGSHGVVSVVRDESGLRLKLDNSYTLGGSLGLSEERGLGHLPLLLHPSPRRVAFLGLGTGVSASAALAHPVEEVLVFELVPEVLRAARELFAEHNLGLAADPRVRLIAADARTGLRRVGGGLDVVVGDLVVPWRRGEAALHTREHFESVRRALRPDGLFCQWVPLFQLTREELALLAATFLDVFPRASAWRGDFIAARPTLALVARADGAALDPEAAERRLRELAPLLALEQRYLVHEAGLWMHRIGSLSADAPWLAGAELNTDAHPLLELRSARTHLPGRAPPGTLLVGSALLSLLTELEAAELARPAPAAETDRRRWAAAGARLFRASTLAEGGRDAEARALAESVLAELPSELRAHLLGAAHAAGTR